MVKRHSWATRCLAALTLLTLLAGTTACNGVAPPVTSTPNPEPGDPKPPVSQSPGPHKYLLEALTGSEPYSLSPVWTVGEITNSLTTRVKAGYWSKDVTATDGTVITLEVRNVVAEIGQPLACSIKVYLKDGSTRVLADGKARDQEPCRVRWIASPADDL
jgi:hypothetical protein